MEQSFSNKLTVCCNDTYFKMNPHHPEQFSGPFCDAALLFEVCTALFYTHDPKFYRIHNITYYISIYPVS